MDEHCRSLMGTKAQPLTQMRTLWLNAGVYLHMQCLGCRWLRTGDDELLLGELGELELLLGEVLVGELGEGDELLLGELGELGEEGDELLLLLLGEEGDEGEELLLEGDGEAGELLSGEVALHPLACWRASCRLLTQGSTLSAGPPIRGMPGMRGCVGCTQHMDQILQ